MRYLRSGLLALFATCAAFFALMDVSAAQTSTPSAILSWQPPATYSDGTTIPAGTAITYNVYQGTSATALAKVATGVTALTDSITTGLTDGNTYYFAVTAVINTVEGPQSNIVSKIIGTPGAVVLTVK